MNRARPRFPLRLYAHRGAAAECPENTLESFRRALEIGVDALESDLHMTRDGHVVVSHDPDGARVAGVARAIRDSTLSEVQSWDAGWGFRAEDGSRPFAGRGLFIPTLDQLLEELPGVAFNFDLKQERPSMVDPVLAALRRHQAEQRVNLASFHMRVLLAIRRRGYRGSTAIGTPEVLAVLWGPPRLYRALPFRGQAAQLPPSSGRFRFDRPGFVDRCHRAGLRLDFWTVNDAARAEQLLELGADGIMTDDPRAIAPVFARRRRSGAAGERERPPGR